MSSLRLNRKLGKFSIPCMILEDNEELVREILRTVLITRAEMIYHSNCIEYIGYSDSFDRISIGQEIPRYEILISDGMFIEWQRYE